MPLHAFLKDAGNSHAREDIFNCRLLYDTKIAAGEHGYHLRSYYSDVDHDGFDVILDDADRVVRLQLKTRLVPAKKARWDDIRKYVLRPVPRYWESFGLPFEASPGVEGGVIVMELTINGLTVNVRYGFTDVYILGLIAQNVINRHHTVRTAAKHLLTALGTGASNACVAVTKPMFVWAAAVDNLLSLMGLHSNSNSNWRGMSLVYLDHTLGHGDVEMPAGNTTETLPGTILEMLGIAAGHNDI
jgi:hypothetical protein